MKQDEESLHSFLATMKELPTYHHKENPASALTVSSSSKLCNHEIWHSKCLLADLFLTLNVSQPLILFCLVSFNETFEPDPDSVILTLSLKRSLLPHPVTRPTTYRFGSDPFGTGCRFTATIVITIGIIDPGPISPFGFNATGIFVGRFYFPVFLHQSFVINSLQHLADGIKHFIRRLLVGLIG
ncbi:MAG: hypothetical protein U5J63_15810 [Fodinibius sp.]|nr:hypothetical protein [Fodinibius sp.]